MSAGLSHLAAAETGISGFLHRQFLESIPALPAGTTFSLPSGGGRTALVTGANVGLGLESCAQLLAAGGVSRLIMGVRTVSKGEAAAAELRARFPGTDAQIDVWQVDMLNPASVQAFAGKCAAELLPVESEGKSGLDLAVLNAGAVFAKFETGPHTPHEKTFQLNYLSTVLLALLLLPTLKATARARGQAAGPSKLTIVSSGTAYSTSFPNVGADPFIPSFSGEEAKKRYSAFDIYSLSKLLEQMFAATLAGLEPGSASPPDPVKVLVSSDDVVVNCSNPGLVRGTSFIGDEMTGGKIGNAIKNFFMLLVGRTMEVGARAYVDAVVVKGKESHGSFLSDGKIKP